jgi:hypothetical protein
MLTKQATIILFTFLIVIWPMLMAKVAWEVAKCVLLSGNSCGFQIVFQCIVFVAPVIWLLIVLLCIIKLKIVVFEENRRPAPVIPDLVQLLIDARNARVGDLHDD